MMDLQVSMHLSLFAGHSDCHKHRLMALAIDEEMGLQGALSYRPAWASCWGSLHWDLILAKSQSRLSTHVKPCCMRPSFTQREQSPGLSPTLSICIHQ